MLPQAEGIEGSIFIIRGSRVMLSTYLAALYNVEPRALVQAVKRNRERFPDDFMFQLTAAEWENLKSQIVISSWRGSRQAAPYAFTEQGIAMLSLVLNSERASQVNINDYVCLARSFLPWPSSFFSLGWCLFPSLYSVLRGCNPLRFAYNPHSL